MNLHLVQEKSVLGLTSDVYHRHGCGQLDGNQLSGVATLRALF